MIIDNSLDSIIDGHLIADNLEHESKHEPSGLLSASWLFQPLRFQIMKYAGVPRKPIDPYVLRKFKRGSDVEDWIVSHMEKAGVLIEKQKRLKYKNAIGYLDALVDSSKMSFKNGPIPHEVKSVTNAKLRKIAATEVDYHYKLQAGFYALALESEYFAVDIVSSEDLRVNTYIFKTREVRQDIVRIIERYDQALENWKTNKVLPKFEVNPNVSWTSNPEYAPFSLEWINMTDEELIKAIDNKAQAVL